MKCITLIVLFGVFAMALARPANSNNEALESTFDAEVDGSYKFHYSDNNFNEREEEGTLRNAGTDQAFVAVKGSYTYYNGDSEPVVVKYTADEKGFQVESAVIPAIITKTAKALGELPPDL